MSPAEPLTVAQALQHATTAGLDRLDAHWLLSEVLARPRTWLLTHEDQPLTEPEAAHWRNGLQRRAQGEPLAYVLGRKEFFGLDLTVSPAVLVPRPDTEILVEWAIELLHQRAHCAGTWQVLDLGTGSGAIALAIKHHCPEAAITAVDASATALSMACANGQRLGLKVRWLASHWWSALAGERFHLIVSNPPYIREDDLHLAALVHEPRMALTAGPDGLADLRHLAAHAPDHLHPGGHLLLEHGHDQARKVHALLADAGFSDIASRPDLAGHLRCTGGTWRAA
jgi:release factor glutamine methyltransferase